MPDIFGRPTEEERNAPPEMVSTADGITPPEKPIESNRELPAEMTAGAMQMSPEDHLEVTLWNALQFVASLVHLFHHPDGTRPNKDMYDAANKIASMAGMCCTAAYENVSARHTPKAPDGTEIPA